MKLSKKQLEQTVLNIISDSVMFFRMCNGVNKILESFNPNEADTFDGENRYYGYDTAMNLMGVSTDFRDEVIREKLMEIFHVTLIRVEEKQDFRSAPLLSKEIYTKWKEYLKTQARY